MFSPLNLNGFTRNSTKIRKKFDKTVISCAKLMQYPTFATEGFCRTKITHFTVTSNGFIDIATRNFRTKTISIILCSLFVTAALQLHTPLNNHHVN